MALKNPPLSPLIVAALLAGCGVAPALIFFDTADVTHNRETAPTGAWAGAGWEFQGEYKNFLGTMISPRHFITAKHIGTGGTTFIHKSFFSGEATDQTYHINPNVNGGTGFWNIGTTDLRVWEIYGEFEDYAPLYTKPNEVGRELVLTGRGRQRGAVVSLSSTDRGWLWSGNDKRARWGVNDVDSIESDATLGEFLVFDFDDIPGEEEVMVASGDSGGATFIKDGPTWKLAAITFGVDGLYDFDDDCATGSGFSGAMYDAEGFYYGSNNAACDNWELIGPSDPELRSRAYVSRISASAGSIQTIIQPAIDDAAKTATQRYDDWIASFGLGTDLLPGDDAESDGWLNVVEYLSATDPSAVDEPMRAFAVESTGGKIRFTVRIRLDAEARGLSWEIEGTDDLVTANYLPVTGLTQVGLTRSLAEGVETIEFEIDQPAGSRMYYRLAVTLAP